MIYVAAYCRVSTEKDDQANSFAAQQQYFRTYIEGNPDWALYAIYADEGISGTSTRKNNVKLSGAAVNGTVLNDGDIFDYNQVVGRRTTENGYGPAPSYINGETVDSIGGGICQTSSTLYLASLLANLEIVERYAHRYTPSYITMGMDATVSWGGPEFRFRNNTGYPIRIDVSYENSEITVSIYGTKTDDITV